MTALVTLSYPLLALLLFRMLPFRHAVAATIVVGYALLPPAYGIALPALPDLDKQLVPVLTALLLAHLFVEGQGKSNQRLPVAAAPDPPLVPLPGWLPTHPLMLACVAVVFLGPVVIYVTNTEPVTGDRRFSPALRPYDIPVMINIAVGTFLGFFVARRYLHDEASHKAILMVLAVVGLAWGVFALFEIRMSPRLNIWIYGYFPHNWAQHVRGGGFRPIVFFEHALRLAIFLCMAAIAVIAYFRTSTGERRALFFLAALFLVAVLFLSRNFGIALIALMLVPLAFVLSARAQVAFAAFCVLLVTLYPAMKMAGVNPLAAAVPILEQLRPDRVASFEYRLVEGDEAIAHANDKPFFGWGIYSRWEATGPDGGTGIVPDAYWIPILARYGWVGYFAHFGIMFLPVVLLFFASGRSPPTPALAGLTMVIAANALDLIPNSAATPITMLIAGAIAGHIDRIRQGVDDPTLTAATAVGPAAALAASGPRRSRYLGRPTSVASGRQEAETASPGGLPVSQGSRYTRFSTRPRQRRV